MNRIVAEGVKAMTEMQLSDGGWGWFSGYGEHSSPHLTAQVVHGLTVAQQNDVPILPDVIQRGVEWLKGYQAGELTKLREGDKHRENPKYDGKAPYKMSADNMDAFVAMVLSEHDGNDPAMTDYLYRDRGNMSVYGLSLTGLVLHKQQDAERRDMVIKNIEQFLEQDDENQTAWLRLPENSWWYWYGSDNEAMAVYLKLLVAVRPNDEIASRLVKYLLNNRKHGTYWDSTRDTAMVVESMADYIKATGEDQPDMTVEILIDGEVQKTVKINGENLFSFDNVLLLEGDAVTAGNHKIEVRRTGKGPVYFSAYLTNFTKEDNITAAGLEVKVDRKFYRLERDDKQVSVQGDRGQVVTQQVAKYKRIPLEDLRSVTSGDLIEVEMVIDSKNDYEYLLLEDHKPSGFEPDDQRSGYVWEGLRAYRELRDDRVSFSSSLPCARGQHSHPRQKPQTPHTRPNFNLRPGGTNRKHPPNSTPPPIGFGIQDWILSVFNPQEMNHLLIVNRSQEPFEVPLTAVLTGEVSWEKRIDQVGSGPVLSGDRVNIINIERAWFLGEFSLKDASGRLLASGEMFVRLVGIAARWLLSCSPTENLKWLSIVFRISQRRQVCKNSVPANDGLQNQSVAQQ